MVILLQLNFHALKVNLAFSTQLGLGHAIAQLHVAGTCNAEGGVPILSQWLAGDLHPGAIEINDNDAWLLS
jgi:hypothetical protein